MEITMLEETLKHDTYLRYLRTMAKRGITCGETIVQHFPNFEECLISLHKERKEVLDKTSDLMTRRFLEFGRKTSHSESPRLTKKHYSLQMIALRTRYDNISQLILVISKIYRETKASMIFIEELLEHLNMQRATYLPFTPKIQDFMKRANSVCNKGKAATKILDRLVNSVVIT